MADRAERPDSPGKTRKGDEPLLAALLAGSTIVDAAKAARINERTARQRLRDSDFRRRLDEGRAEIIGMVAAQLAAAAEVGYGVLLELAQNTSVQPAVRRNAARDLIALAGELGAARDVEARVEALEEALRRFERR